MAGERMPQGSWRSLVEQNPHDFDDAVVASSHGQALLGVLENGLDLFTCDAGEPLQKIIHPCAILQVGKEGLHGNSRTGKNPGPADLFRNSLDRWALVPIKHERRLRDPANARQAGRIGTEGQDVALLLDRPSVRWRNLTED